MNQQSEKKRTKQKRNLQHLESQNEVVDTDRYLAVSIKRGG